MTTPNKQAILEKALELWHQDRLRSNQPYETMPEESELKEEGYLIAAQQILMHDQRQNETYADQFSDLQQPEQSIPFDFVEAMRTGVTILGTRQSGKTTLAMQLTDALIKHGVIVYCIDPSTVWQSRRNDFNVLSIPEPSSSTHTLTWRLTNTIFDTSLLGPQKQRDFTELYASITLRTLTEMPQQTRPQIFVWLEEAHNSLPLWIFNSKQMPELKRLITVGANLHVSFGLITQFAAEVSKLPVKATQQRYFGLTSEPNDIRYVKGFIRKEESEQLRNLDTGEFFYSYRNTLTRFRTQLERNLNLTAPLAYTYNYGGD